MWMVYICVMQAPNMISLRLSQKMPSILGIVAVDKPKSVQANMARK
jgi:hypothetical protein